MVEFVLEAEPRTIVGKKVSQLRNQGLVPATIYGPKTDAVSVQIPYRPLQLMLMKAGGTNLIELKVNGKTHTVLARHVQRDFIRASILHVDFFAVDLEATVTAQVPIHVVGESQAVVARLGILITGTTTLTIEALPAKLLSQITVDVTDLKELGDAIHVRDLILGPDIVILNDPDDMIARITQTSAARADEEEEALEETPISAEVEVISRGKEEEDEEDS